MTYAAATQALPNWLDQSYGLYQEAGGYYTGYRGRGEKYLRGTSTANGHGSAPWYDIVPNGDRFKFTPSYSNPLLTGVLVAHLGSAVCSIRSQLWNATNTAVPADSTVVTNTRTIAPSAGYAGTFVVIASVSDGQATASRSLEVTVVEPLTLTLI